MARGKLLVASEQVGEMLIHCAHDAAPDCRCPLQFGTAANEAGDRATQRDFASSAIDHPRARRELVDGASAIRNDQRRAARTCLGSDHAERLCLAAMNQRIRARE